MSNTSAGKWGRFFVERNQIMAATEASLTAKDIEASGIGVTESMKIAICTDRIIENAGLKEVTSPIMFSGGYTPNDGGLFGIDIFGETMEERKKTYAYINLGRKFFHPFVFDVCCRSSTPFKDIATGQKVGHIAEDGTLSIVIDKSSPEYDESHTGIKWLIENFHQIKWRESEALDQKDRIRLLKNLSDEEIFISKWLVVPVFYRDIEYVNNRPSIPQVNNLYNRLIQWSKSVGDDDIFAFVNDGLIYRMQMTLEEIRALGESLFTKKNGHYHQAILGKSIDYGSLDVISVPVFQDIQRPEENPIDVFHVGIPLSKCISLGFPFMQRYIMNFFEENLRDSDSVMIYEENADTKMRSVSIKALKDHAQIYNQKKIEKRLEEFMNNAAGRFETIKVYFKDGTIGEYYYKGFGYPASSGTGARPETATIAHRPMTWCDLVYLAAVETLSDKYVYVTRYPVTSFLSTFANLCVPMSTVKTMPAIVDGKLYRNYPCVDLSLPPNKVATLWVDTLTMSDLFLNALGGDYDGDTVSSKLCFSLEANEEAEALVTSLKYFLTTQGDMVRNVGNEAYLCFYNMTRRE